MKHLKQLLTRSFKAIDRFPRRVVLAVGAACIALGIMIALAGLAGLDAEPTSPEASPSQKASPSPVSTLPTRTVVHRRGDFRVEVPKRFAIKRTGERMVLTSRDKQVVATLTRTRDGATQPVLESQIDAVRASYQDVAPGRTRVRRFDGRVVRYAVGKASNSRGVSLLYLTSVVKVDKQNLALTAFTAANKAPAEVLPQLNAVVNSLEPTPDDRSRKTSEQDRGR